MKFTKILLVGLFVLFMFGCAAHQVAIPEGCGNSILYTKFGSELKMIDSVLKISNLSALREDVYTRNEAVAVINDLLSVIEAEPTYFDFAMIVWRVVTDINEKHDTELLLISEIIFESFNLPIPIDPCDKELIIEHLNKQKRLMMLLQT